MPTMLNDFHFLQSRRLRRFIDALDGADRAGERGRRRRQRERAAAQRRLSEALTLATRKPRPRSVFVNYRHGTAYTIWRKHKPWKPTPADFATFYAEAAD